MENVKSVVGTCCLMGGTVASAATLVTDSNGLLIGARGVSLGTDTYDVNLVDDSCASAFGGCDQNSDFTFQSQADASAFASAFLTQVIEAYPIYDTDVTKALGCVDSNSDQGCFYRIPYEASFSDPQRFAAEVGWNRGNSNVLLSFTNQQASTNYGSSSFLVTTVATPVPVPASLPLLLAGLGVLAVGRRRLNKTTGQ